MVDAYKTYYKIKKKLEEQQQQDQDKSVAVSHDDLPPEPQHEQQNDEPTKKDATPPEDLSSAWGDHLNKPKAVQDAAKAPASKSSPSSVPANYSKLTEKLMKGYHLTHQLLQRYSDHLLVGNTQGQDQHSVQPD